MYVHVQIKLTSDKQEHKSLVSYPFKKIVSVYHMSAWCLWKPDNAIRFPVLELQIVMAQMWLLGIEPGSSRGTASALKC